MVRRMDLSTDQADTHPLLLDADHLARSHRLDASQDHKPALRRELERICSTRMGFVELYAERVTPESADRVCQLRAEGCHARAVLAVSTRCDCVAAMVPLPCIVRVHVFASVCMCVLRLAVSTKAGTVGRAGCAGPRQESFVPRQQRFGEC